MQRAALEYGYPPPDSHGSSQNWITWSIYKGLHKLSEGEFWLSGEDCEAAQNSSGQRLFARSLHPCLKELPKQCRTPKHEQLTIHVPFMETHGGGPPSWYSCEDKHQSSQPCWCSAENEEMTPINHPTGDFLEGAQLLGSLNHIPYTDPTKQPYPPKSFQRRAEGRCTRRPRSFHPGRV